MPRLIYYLVNKLLMNESEKDILNFLGSYNKTIFDVGCYSGAFTKNIIKEDEKKNLKSNFYLFDPNPKVKNYLKSLLKKNNIKYFNVALDNSNQEKEFFLNKFFESSGSSLNSITINDKKWMISRKLFMQLFQPFKKLNSYEKIYVKTQTIDTFCENNKIDKIDILKIDTEGNELNVLRGSEKLLSKNNIKIIYVEIIESKDNYSKKESLVVEYLKKYNFNLKKTYKIKSLSLLSDLKGTDNLFINENYENKN